jgi:hypothetical protein
VEPARARTQTSRWVRWHSHCNPQAKLLLQPNKYTFTFADVQVFVTLYYIAPVWSTYFTLKMTTFCDTAPCILVEVDLCFTGAYCLHHQDNLFFSLMMEAVSTSEMSVCFKETTWRYIPKGCHFHTCHHENLKSQYILLCWCYCTAEEYLGWM